MHTKPLLQMLEDGKSRPVFLRVHLKADFVLVYRFLLKYTSRDTVDLLERGVGGFSEARLVVEKYEEKSPLYGFVLYRRRKVILKYVPEGTSRLLQARLAVQFQSVLETFSPHDTVFSFKEASELNESALASACMLHNSAASLTSDSSSSLRRSRLGGIAEDVEEGRTAHVGKGRALTTPESTEAGDVRLSKNEKAGTSFAPAIMGSSLSSQEEETTPKQIGGLSPRVDSLELTKATSPPALHEYKPSVRSQILEKASLRPTEQATSSVNQLQNEKPSSPHLSHSKPLPARPEETSPKKQLDVQSVHQEENDWDYRSRQSDETNRPSFDHRQSSQTLRPQADDAASQYSGYSAYKPKKKLGPRPHKEPEGRPKTSGAASKDQRAVANLPTNLRISNRTNAIPVARPGSQHSSRSVPSNFRHRSELLPSADPPPLPQPASQIAELYRPPDPGSFISTAAFNPQKGPSITPEKLRLMKALQMRKKQQALAKRKSLVSPTDVDFPKADEAALSEAQSGPEKSTGTPIFSDIGQHRVGTKSEHAALPTSSSPVDRNTDISSPVSSLAENDRPTQASDVTNNVILKELQKQPPVKKDSGISSLADVETSPHDPAIGPPADSTTKIQEHVDAHETKQSKSEGTTHEEDVDSRAKKPKPDPLTLSPSPPSVFVTSQDQVQSARDHDDVTNDIQGSRLLSDISGTDMPDRNRKRQSLVEPIKVLSSPEASDISDDDSFDEELEQAKLEQAKPISVARSPITPIFTHNSDRPGDVTRAASAPMKIVAEGTTSTFEKTRSIGGRSASTALPALPPMTGDSGYALAAKKGTVSSGITTRIKALESFSRRETNSSPPQTPVPLPINQKSSSSIWSFKKRTSIAQIRSNVPNMSTSTLPPRQLPTTQTTSTPEKIQSLSSTPWLQRTGSAAQLDAPMQKGESISVTARIIRDQNHNPADHPDDSSELLTMNLHRSPLTVEHERAETQSQSVMSSAGSTIRANSSPTSPKARFSFSSSRASVPRLPTSDSMASRMSQGSSHKKMASGNMPLSPSDSSSIAEDRPKESRASRLMKRMSNLTGGSRRNLFTSLSPNGREPLPPVPIAEHRESLTEQSSLSDSLSHVVDIGDVNVQFPDTLLWKRRFMRIDDQGYLVLTPPTKETMERNRGISRKFHLSEFRKPTLPDPEREELPWSILLDFEDGTCLQCACESRYAQTQVLRMLVDAHSAYHQLYVP